MKKSEDPVEREARRVANKLTCLSKRRYLSQRDALKAAQLYRVKVYQCRVCRGWHLTSR